MFLSHNPALTGTVGCKPIICVTKQVSHKTSYQSQGFQDCCDNQGISEGYANSLWTADCFLLAFTQLGPGPGLAVIVTASRDSQES